MLPFIIKTQITNPKFEEKKKNYIKYKQYFQIQKYLSHSCIFQNYFIKQTVKSCYFEPDDDVSLLHA